MAAGTGNITLNAAALSSIVNRPSTIAATAGTPQSALIGTAFATALQATVKDSAGNPLSGVTVTFTAPSSGAGATFPGQAVSAAVTTGADGNAAAPALTANGTAGKYTVTASVSGVATAAVFNLTNSIKGLLTGSGTSATTAVNLTSEATTDWEHWGDGLNRKANVTAVLPNYTLIGGGSPLAYNNDLRPISWTDGAPAASSSNNLTGLYIAGAGHGFSLAAPADTTIRTLVVHVGGWNSAGKLTAHLSDGSAPDFVDTTTLASGQFDRNYSLTYNAGAAGQTLTITWTMVAGTGNVTLNALALSPFVSRPATIAATGGTPQTAPTGTVFATPLQATVKDLLGNPVSGAVVTFTAPSSGAGATFAGLATATATTGADGKATAPALTANAVVGSYSVTASVSGVSAAAVFSLTNAVRGSLAASGTSGITAVNLTAEGTTDWEHWGDGLNRKARVTAVLTNYTAIGGGSATAYSNDLRPISWSDGAPVATSSNNLTGLYLSGVGHGFSLTAPADTTIRTLVVHVGGWNSGGTLRAHLSDGSAVDFLENTALVNGQFDRNYTITYNAAAAGQTLTITWTMVTGSGNVTLNAAAIR
jgi:hypothetical protein